MKRNLTDRIAEYNELVGELRTKAIGMFTLDDLEFIQEKRTQRLSSPALMEAEEKFYSEDRIRRLKRLLHR